MSDAAEWLTAQLAQRAAYDGILRLCPSPMGQARERWNATGLAALTGPADGDAMPPARDYAERLDALIRATQAFAASFDTSPPTLDMRLFRERVAERGLQRGGAISASGKTRILRCADGWAVVSLTRPDDLYLFEAWIGEPAGSDPWRTLTRVARRLNVDLLIADGRLLGLPVGRVHATADEQLAARPEQSGGVPRVHRWGPSAKPRDPTALLVVDLSALWAGPLCGRLFAEMGARVVKVESLTRPDGARSGTPAFFERMHQGKTFATFDFTTDHGRRGLRELIATADVVIEASRPRAMAQLGIDPLAIARARPDIVWISLTAYGRTGPWSNAVGYGDDCAAAAGLVVHDDRGTPMFVGDALADPIAGLMATAAGLATLAAGGGAMIDASLRESALFVAQAPRV